MKLFVVIIGRALYWLSWPVLAVYFRMSERTRVLVMHGNDVLVVKPWIGRGKWCLPGGGLCRGEQALPGAVREVSEELGLKLSPQSMHYLGVGHYDFLGLKYTYHLFVIKVPRKLPFKRELIELADARWISPEHLTKRNSELDTMQALKMYNSAPTQR